MIHVRSFTSSLAVRDGGDGRTLHGPVLPWGIEARVVDAGRLVTETFERGALAGTDPARVPLTATHPRDAAPSPSGSPWPSTIGRMPPGASGGSRTPCSATRSSSPCSAAMGKHAPSYQLMGHVQGRCPACRQKLRDRKRRKRR
jgi:hypothetical protein